MSDRSLQTGQDGMAWPRATPGTNQEIGWRIRREGGKLEKSWAIQAKGRKYFFQIREKNRGQKTMNMYF